MTQDDHDHCDHHRNKTLHIRYSDFFILRLEPKTCDVKVKKRKERTFRRK